MPFLSGRREGGVGPGIGLDRSRASAAAPGASRMRMILAGMPATTALAGTSLVTTELVPTIALSPTRTPRRTQAP